MEGAGPVKLASLRQGGRDGTLIVVDRRLASAVRVPDVATTLQSALESWDTAAPRLRAVAKRLEQGDHPDSFPLDPAALAAPLPRAYQWVDGSAFLSHAELVRRARGAEMPETFRSDPLMYQGASDVLLGPRQAIQVADESWGIDLEAEVAVITGDVPMGAGPERSGASIRLLVLANDVSLRNLIPAELAKGFGFLQAKPATAFSPVAVTPDELGAAWDGSSVHLPLRSSVNGRELGRPEAGEDMQFGFPELIAHAARTRFLTA
ncbi:MAG: fumarylacetoacetate hydrolase, partial [Candidatus Binatota bacterium]|nr:fumarylacetoacetate hydrolase [Candidatus Binatota bacterium]